MSYEHNLKRLAKEHAAVASEASKWAFRAAAIIAPYDRHTQRGLTEKQRALVVDPAVYKSARCPRRSGKSYAAASYALHVGERKPGQRVLIIGLTLKSAKENFWATAPGGLHSVAGKYELGVVFNSMDMSWKHENGSVGYLAGAETSADLERLRGSKVEADLIIVDECKSFSPDLLHQLVTDILSPGLMTREGTLMLIGTPGSIPVGPFYEATCESYRHPFSKQPTCLPFYADRSGFSDEEQEVLWSLHTWTLADNVAKPKQWARALRDKRKNGWGDDHPTWRREYLGEWVVENKELVYHQYVAAQADPGLRANWIPDRNSKEPYGLPEGGGPWHFIAGLDWGYEDPTALVVAAYGEHDPHLYAVEEYKEEHLTYDDVKALLDKVISRRALDIIVYDRAGKQLGESLAGDGYPAVPADRHEKFDFVELLNSDFASGRVKIVRDTRPGSLHHELMGLQFDLSRDSKERLARLGRLKEDPACPNHLADAMLYLWRWSYHQFSRDRDAEIAPGSQEWWREYERTQKSAAETAWLSRNEGGHLKRHGRVDHAIARDRILH